MKHPDGSFDRLTVTLRRGRPDQCRPGRARDREAVRHHDPVAITYSPTEAVGIGAQRTGDALGLIVGGLGQLVDAVVHRPTEAPPAAGPVGIAIQFGDVFWQLGPIITLYVAGSCRPTSRS